MRLVNLSCPGCSAQMLMDRVNKRAYCEYCGTVLMLVDFEKKTQSELAENLPASSDLTSPMDLSGRANYRFEMERLKVRLEEREKASRSQSETVLENETDEFFKKTDLEYDDDDEALE